MNGEVMNDKNVTILLATTASEAEAYVDAYPGLLDDVEIYYVEKPVVLAGLKIDRAFVTAAASFYSVALNVVEKSLLETNGDPAPIVLASPAGTGW